MADWVSQEWLSSFSLHRHHNNFHYAFDIPLPRYKVMQLGLPDVWGMAQESGRGSKARWETMRDSGHRQHPWTRAICGLCFGITLLVGSGTLRAEAEVNENNDVFQYSISNPGYRAFLWIPEQRASVRG